MEGQAGEEPAPASGGGGAEAVVAASRGAAVPASCSLALDDDAPVANYSQAPYPTPSVPKAPQPTPQEGNDGDYIEHLNLAREVHERQGGAAKDGATAGYVHRAMQVDHGEDELPTSQPPMASNAPVSSTPPPVVYSQATACSQPQFNEASMAQQSSVTFDQLAAAVAAQQFSTPPLPAPLPALHLLGQTLSNSLGGLSTQYAQQPPRSYGGQQVVPQHSDAGGVAVASAAGLTNIVSDPSLVARSMYQPPISLPQQQQLPSIHPVSIPHVSQAVTGFGGPSSPSTAQAQLGPQAQVQPDGTVVQVVPVPRPRWRPTLEQVQLLEKFFMAGNTKPTKELTEQVMQAGEATEQQVLVWLKNRLARQKRDVPSKGEGQKDGAGAGAAAGAGTNGAPSPWDAMADTLKQSTALLGAQADAASAVAGAASGIKRDHAGNSAQHLVAAHQSIRTAALAIQELGTCMMTMDMVAMEELLQEMRKAPNLYVYGVGREGLMMRSWVFRLNQLKLKAYYIGESVCPPLSAGDLLITSAGPAYYGTVAAMCNEARAYGARTAAFTANPTAVLTFADIVVRIPAHCPSIHDPPPARRRNRTSTQSGYDKPSSVLLLGGQYELALHLATDVIATCIFQACDMEEESLRAQNFNVN